MIVNVHTLSTFQLETLLRKIKIDLLSENSHNIGFVRKWQKSILAVFKMGLELKINSLAEDGR